MEVYDSRGKIKLMALSPAKRVLTRNRMGWASERLGAVSLEFVEWAAGCGGVVLDVGAGYGAAARAAAARGARVVANDLEVGSLGEGAGFEVKLGRFPRGLEFEDGSLAGVHASNVLHFLTGRQVREGFRKMARWVRPGGRVYVQAATPYQGVWGEFGAEYEGRVAAGVEWPGLMEKVSDWVSHRQRSQMPGWIHLLDDVVLRREAERAGFRVLKAWMYRREDLPRGLWGDGRETVGLVGERGNLDGF